MKIEEVFKLGLGFRKVDPDRMEFANEGFLRGQKHLLKTIRRRRPPSQTLVEQHQQLSGPFVEVAQFGVNGEIDRLRRDRSVLMAELVKLRQEQHNTRAHIKELEERLQGTEQKQQQMMAFLARAMRNQDFLRQLAQYKGRKELEKAISKKRRRPIEQGALYGNAGPSGGSRDTHTPVKVEYQELLGNFYGYGITELERLALEMNGFGKTRESDEENGDEEDGNEEMNDRFWEELLNDGIDEQGVESDVEGKDYEDVCVLADKLGYLISTSPT